MNPPDEKPGIPVHVENRRLFATAAGTLKLNDWERHHLHDCGVCQAVLSVFISPHIGLLNDQPK
jgi:hypothetical protein